MDTADIVTRALGVAVPVLGLVSAWVLRGDNAKRRLERIQMEIETLKALPKSETVARKSLQKRIRKSVKNYDYYVRLAGSRRASSLAIVILVLCLVSLISAAIAGAILKYDKDHQGSKFLDRFQHKAELLGHAFLAYAVVLVALSLLLDPRFRKAARKEWRNALAGLSHWREARRSRKNGPAPGGDAEGQSPVDGKDSAGLVVRDS